MKLVLVGGCRNAEDYARVEELKKEFPKAHAVDPDDVRVIYVITDDPDKYAEHVGA